MTLAEMQRSDKLLLSPDEIADALGLAPQSIRNQAAIDPLMLGFPVLRCGHTTKIPRIPLLRWLGVFDESQTASRAAKEVPCEEIAIQ